MILSNDIFLSDSELLNRLLQIPLNEMRGSNMQEIIENLLHGSDKNEAVFMIKEIAQRYGEIRLKLGDYFTNSSQIFEHYKLRLSQLKQETFITVILDNKHRIIIDQVISIGILNKSLVHPREVFVPALERRAAAIVLCHCHPSGDPKPSTQDKEITKRLVEVGKLIGINVLDHLIIGDNGYYSFVDEDVMPA
jgi:DNA repair protein RadC